MAAVESMDYSTTTCNGYNHWCLEPSKKATTTFNPIRRIVDNMDIQPNPELKMINLSLGDPTVGGILKPHPVVLEAAASCLLSGKCNGYSPAFGSLASRKAVAAKFSTPDDVITAEDVILTNGCSAAIDLAICGLANPGDNILVPMPGFAIYKTLAESVDIECRSYTLMPDRKWEVDLEHMESLINEKTRAIIVNNPSNPCGSVWSASHIRDIIAIAERHCLPIIADELYWECTFTGHKFVSFSSLSRNVPIISCRGIAKCYFVPGWRVGWIQMHDRNGVLAKVKRALRNLSQRLLGPNSVVEAALPVILSPAVPDSYFKEASMHVEHNAEISYNILSKIPGLKPIKPSGAMYMMVGIDPHYFTADINDPLRFTEQLIREQSVFCLPAKCFQAPNFIRLVLTPSHGEMRDACDRIVTFCKNHMAFG